MHTPSLRRRVILSGAAVFLVVLVAFDAFVYLTLRNSLEGALAEVLESRVELAREFGAVLEPAELADHLTAAGVPVMVSTADGRVIRGEPALPRFQQGPPGAAAGVAQPRVSRTIALPDGTTVQVFATRVGVDVTLERARLLLAVGSLLAIMVSALLLRRSTSAAMAPLDDVVGKAGRTAAGHLGERLEPDDPTSELGRMAVAYDEMLDTLETALEQARVAEERTRRFLDDAAHQLRTPIAAVRASVESLLRAVDPEEQDRLMANVVRETGRSSRMLQDLLTLARLDEGEPRERQRIDVVAIVRDEVDRTASLAPHLTIELAGPDGAVPVSGDERLLREAVANLLDNARRHAQQVIDVSVSSQGATVEVAIGDDGPGVPEDRREVIFERFVSLGDHGGTGLGLAIAREIAEVHGGDIGYETERFVLRLVAAPVGSVGGHPA